MARAKRKRSEFAQDLGCYEDPIRQQGRDPRHDYQPPLWYVTPQRADRSRKHARQRVYHGSYETSSGHTPDEHFERLARIAAEIEEAGINLGWGGCADFGGAKAPESVEAEVRRRYADLFIVEAVENAERRLSALGRGRGHN